MPKDYIPRLTVDITEEQARELSRLIPHGLRRPLFGAIVDDVITMCQKHGIAFIAAVINKDMNYEEFTSLKIGASNGNNS